MADKRKQGQVAERIKQIVSTLLQFEAKDPRLAEVTVVDAEIDRELMYATLYVRAFGGEEVRDEVMAALHGAVGFLRHEVGERMALRRVPELRFEWDETAEYAARIEDLLDSLDIPSAGDEGDSDAQAPDAE
jgi:ribosome-binding factor A